MPTSVLTGLDVIAELCDCAMAGFGQTSVVTPAAETLLAAYAKALVSIAYCAVAICAQRHGSRSAADRSQRGHGTLNHFLTPTLGLDKRRHIPAPFEPWGDLIPSRSDWRSLVATKVPPVMAWNHTANCRLINQ